ncbi:reverse transcriptase [Phytophthora megakarya]|uniref:Reverse transcriptase n=1 Tax=Phytophthora megakarya TaxID=4795 RepID=A0A225V209_9STRA|nr:reverse transcriptase [Phytophthora megakarya]
MRVSAEELDLDPAVYLREGKTRPEPAEQTHPDLSPEVETLDRESMADVENNTQVPEPSVDVQSQTSCLTPVQRLEAEYAGVMRVSAEEVDLEPAVYLREGSDLMAQLEYQLIMPPEIEELTQHKNGIDIRMCIDYRLLNLLIKLFRYPLPLIDDL